MTRSELLRLTLSRRRSVRMLGRTEKPAHRKALLLTSILYYLGVLAFFKYFNFAADSLATVMSWAGVKIAPQ